MPDRAVFNLRIESEEVPKQFGCVKVTSVVGDFS